MESILGGEPMKRLHIQFCPFCGCEILGYEVARIRCTDCGRLFSVEELPLLRRAAPV